MKTKIVFEEHEFRVNLADDGKEARDMGPTEKPSVDVEPILGANLGKVVKALNSENNKILAMKLKFHKPGDSFKATLKYVRKDDSPEPDNPLDQADSVD